MKLLFKNIALLLVFLIITGFCSLHAQKGDIVVEVSGLKNLEGNLCIALFYDGSGFPTNQDKTTIKKIVPVKSKKMTFTLPNIKYGVYALSVVHDENKNNKIDFHLLGFPKEGYGVSNNIRNTFGPPKFSDCAFALYSDVKHIKIDIYYFGKK